MIPAGLPVRVPVSQYDDASRDIVFNLISGDVPFSVPSGADVTCDGTKPDGFSFIVPATFSGSAVTMTVTEQMAAVSGDSLCQITIRSGGAVIGSANFILAVEKGPIGDGSIVSDSDMSAIAKYANDAIKSAQEAAQSAEQAAASVENVESQLSDAKDGVQQAITDAGTAKTALEETISNSESAKTNLEASISTAENTKSGLDDANQETGELLEQLQQTHGGWYTPSVSEDGTLSWAANYDTMPEVPSQNIKGPQGPTGPTPNIQIGTVTTLEPGSKASASMGGTAENPLLNMGIPAGQPGSAGKTAYQYAQEGGYTGSEEDFAAKLAAEMPTVDDTLTQTGQAADAAAVGDAISSLSEEKVNLPKDTDGSIIAGANGQYATSDGAGGFNWTDGQTALPNPNALTFTGAVTGSYDGSSKMSARIPQVVSWANKELFNKADLVDPGNNNSFVTVDGVEYYRYPAGPNSFYWENPYPLTGSLTITYRILNQYNNGVDTSFYVEYSDGTDTRYMLTYDTISTFTTDASKAVVKVRGNYDAENWMLLDMSVMSIVANYDVGVPLADSNAPGGIIADPATETDTVPAKIGEDGKLYVPNMSGGSGGSTVSGDYIPVPSTAEVGQTIVVKAVDENGKPTEWEAADALSDSDGWSEIGEITLDGTEFSISAYSDGVVTITPENGVYPPAQKNTVLRKTDYSAHTNVRFIATETDGQYTMVNLDGAVYAPTDDMTQYVVDVPNDSNCIEFSNIPEFLYYKVEITAPILSAHGARNTILVDGKIHFGLGAGSQYLAGGPAEIVVETDESPIAEKYYVKASVKGKNPSRSNGYDTIDLMDKSANNFIRISHYNGLLTTGTKAKLWGRN